MFEKIFETIDNILEEMDVEIIIKEKDPKKAMVNNINQIIRFSGIIGGIKNQLKDKFLFSSEKRELEQKLEVAEREFLRYRQNVANLLDIDVDNLARIKH